MGNPASKHQDTKKDEEPSEANLPSTPIQTPKSTSADFDPRSPSANIARTPIQVSLLEESIPEAELEVEAEAKTEQSVCIDPRSPTAEFTRTPIVVENLPKLRNKALDSVRQQLTNFSPLKKTSKCDIDTFRGPKLLESSPLTKTPDQSDKRKSYVGLLETNLDYVETDLDTVANMCQNIPEDIDKATIGTETDIETTEAISAAESLELSGKTSEEASTLQGGNGLETDTPTPGEDAKEKYQHKFNPSVLEDEEFQKEEDLRPLLYKHMEVFLRNQLTELQSPNANIVRTAISAESTNVDKEKNEEEDEVQLTERMKKFLASDDLDQDIDQEVDLEFDEDQVENQGDPLMKDTKSQVSEEENFDVTPINETLKKISQIDKEVIDVITIAQNPIQSFEPNPTYEFDKKLSNLIYEDQEIAENIPKTIRIKEKNTTSIATNKERTPLGVRNINQKKNKLKVSDKPTKQEYAVSKIPVFKDQKGLGKSKIVTQCENTPPRNVKPRKTQWDADNTLII